MRRTIRVSLSDDTKAVVFDFVNPPWPARRFFRQPRQARFEAKLEFVRVQTAPKLTLY
jgi:hypothetical protein